MNQGRARGWGGLEQSGRISGLILLRKLTNWCQEMRPAAGVLKPRDRPASRVFVLGPFRHIHTTELWFCLALRDPPPTPPPQKRCLQLCQNLAGNLAKSLWQMISTQVSSNRRFVCLHNETNWARGCPVPVWLLGPLPFSGLELS